MAPFAARRRSSTLSVRKAARYKRRGNRATLRSCWSLYSAWPSEASFFSRRAVLWQEKSQRFGRPRSGHRECFRPAWSSCDALANGKAQYKLKIEPIDQRGCRDLRRSRAIHRDPSSSMFVCLTHQGSRSAARKSSFTSILPEPCTKHAAVSKDKPRPSRPLWRRNLSLSVRRRIRTHAKRARTSFKISQEKMERLKHYGPRELSLLAGPVPAFRLLGYVD